MKGLAVPLIALAMWSVAPPARASVTLIGKVEQGALVVGQTEPGSHVMLDGVKVMVSRNGLFALGFDRDHGPRAGLIVTTPRGTTETKALAITPRHWDVQGITGVEPRYVTPSPEDLVRIAREVAEKNAARVRDTNEDWFAHKFIWPASGRISGVFGSQRIFNGEPRRPHYGVDIAAPAGAPVVAPADGIIRLAEPDMYFEGGLIFLDHGQGVISVLMHMSRIDVKVGERVHQGDLLGAAGKTGRATGPHVHWGMVWGAAHVDPSLLVSGMGPSGAVPGVAVTSR